MLSAWRRLTEMVRRSRLERELDDEVAFHLRMLEEQFRARGMGEAEAKAAARREFGGVAYAREKYRDERGLPWLETSLRDARYALRGLRRSPGFTAAAVLSLALGIGANTAIFSLFHALMLRMLPVAHPEQLVSLYQTGGWLPGHSSYPLFEDIAGRTRLFQGVLARTGLQKVRFRGQTPARENLAFRELVSGSYFQMLGVKAALGRLFTPEDDRIPGAHPLAVLSYDCWRNRFGADPSVLGSTIVVDEKPLTVIGVAARGFRGIQVEQHPDVWVPLTMAEMDFKNESAWWLQMVARVSPETPRRQLQAAVDVVMRQHLAAAYPGSADSAFRKRVLSQRLEVRDAGVGLSLLREEFARPLQVLMAAVVLVLLMACANVANLLLARGAARRREVALRVSIGATRARLIRQALTESAILAAAGGGLGIVLGSWGTQAITRFLPADAGNPLDAAPDPAVLAFTLGVAALSALLFGLLPALRSTAVHPSLSLRSGMTAAEGTPLLRRALVVAQVALSTVLVVMASLFGHSLFELRSVDLGFRNLNVIAFNLDFPREWRPQDTRTPFRLLTGRLQALPGIVSVSYGFPGPYQMGRSSAAVRVPGSERTGSAPVEVEAAAVAPRYFETLGTPLRAGREFDKTDLAESRKVAVVNAAFVRAFLPGEAHPERRFLSFDGRDRVPIIGIVSDIRWSGIRNAAKPTVYMPAGSNINLGWQVLLVRTALPAPALLRAVYAETKKLGPGIVVQNFATLRQYVDDSIFEQRLLATLSGFFGVLALALAAVGLYGIVSYGTAGRTGEIGVRIALGARRAQVLWMILRNSLALVSLGLALGLVVSAAAARAVGSVLFGIQPSDPAAFAFTVFALAVTGLVAAFLPARRAASLDPMRALRHD